MACCQRRAGSTPVRRSRAPSPSSTRRRGGLPRPSPLRAVLRSVKKSRPSPAAPSSPGSSTTPPPRVTAAASSPLTGCCSERRTRRLSAALAAAAGAAARGADERGRRGGGEGGRPALRRLRRHDGAAAGLACTPPPLHTSMLHTAASHLHRFTPLHTSIAPLPCLLQIGPPPHFTCHPSPAPPLPPPPTSPAGPRCCLQVAGCLHEQARLLRRHGCGLRACRCTPSSSPAGGVHQECVSRGAPGIDELTSSAR